MTPKYEQDSGIDHNLGGPRLFHARNARKAIAADDTKAPVRAALATGPAPYPPIAELWIVAYTLPGSIEPSLLMVHEADVPDLC
jgi:hypothetical protein